MFGLNDGMRYYVCQRYVRMNLGINGLYKLVSQEMDLPPEPYSSSSAKTGSR